MTDQPQATNDIPSLSSASIQGIVLAGEAGPVPAQMQASMAEHMRRYPLLALSAQPVSPEEPVVFLDPKGDPDMVRQASNYLAAQGRSPEFVRLDLALASASLEELDAVLKNCHTHIFFKVTP